MSDESRQKKWDEYEEARAADSHLPPKVLDDFDDSLEIESEDEQDESEETEEQKAASDKKTDDESTKSDEADGETLSIEEQLQRQQEDRELQDLKYSKLERQMKSWMSQTHKLQSALDKRGRPSSDEQVDDLGGTLRSEEANNVFDDKDQSRSPAWVEDFRVRENQKVFSEVAMSFHKQFPDMTIEDADGNKIEDPALGKYVNDHGASFQVDLNVQSSTPGRIEKAAMTLLRDARDEILEERKVVQIDERRRKRATQNKAGRQRKKALGSSAASSQSSSASDTSTENKKKSRREQAGEALEAWRKNQPNYVPFDRYGR